MLILCVYERSELRVAVVPSSLLIKLVSVVRVEIILVVSYFTLNFSGTGIVIQLLGGLIL